MFGLTLPAMEPLEATALWEAKLLHGPELEHQALGWVERGIETEAALSLAFEVPEIRSETMTLLRAIIQEMTGLSLVSARQLGWVGARLGLRQILDREWPAFEGARWLLTLMDAFGETSLFAMPDPSMEFKRAQNMKNFGGEVEFAGEKWRLHGIYWGRYLVDEYPFGSVEQRGLGEVEASILSEAKLTYNKNFSNDALLPEEY